MTSAIASTPIVLVYTTQALPTASLLHALARDSLPFQIAPAYEQPGPAAAVHAHTQAHIHTPAGEPAPHPRLLVVADAGMAPGTHPQTALVAMILDAEKAAHGTAEDGAYQSVRVLAASVARVVETLVEGRHTWSEFWSVAQENEGYFPGA